MKVRLHPPKAVNVGVLRVNRFLLRLIYECIKLLLFFRPLLCARLRVDSVEGVHELVHVIHRDLVHVLDRRRTVANADWIYRHLNGKLIVREIWMLLVHLVQVNFDELLSLLGGYDIINFLILRVAQPESPDVEISRHVVGPLNQVQLEVLKLKVYRALVFVVVQLDVDVPHSEAHSHSDVLNDRAHVLVRSRLARRAVLCLRGLLRGTGLFGLRPLLRDLLVLLFLIVRFVGAISRLVCLMRALAFERLVMLFNTSCVFGILLCFRYELHVELHQTADTVKQLL